MCERATRELCDDMDLCTIDFCEDNAGSQSCSNTAVNCSDTDMCTDDSCDGADGSCLNVYNTSIPGCSFGSPCVNLTICNDDNPCTRDICTTVDPLSMNPTHNCTNDALDNAVLCGASDMCVTKFCARNPSDPDNLNQCNQTFTDCDDGLACTVDTCDPDTGCEYTTLDCDDGLLCTIDTCNNSTGCSNAPIVCDDSNGCTTESCNPATGICDAVNVVCDDSNACTADSCQNDSPTTHTCIFDFYCNNTVDVCRPGDYFLYMLCIVLTSS